MSGPLASGATVAIVDRPDTSLLTLALVAVVAGWIVHLWVGYSTRPPTPAADEGTDAKPEPLPDGTYESPAVVGLLTNEFSLPPAAITATAIDLAGRGWLAIGVLDDEIVLILRRRPGDGDALAPYERQVLDHVAARAFNDVSSAATLVLSQPDLDRRWRGRMSAAVASIAQHHGWSRPRFGVTHLAIPGAGALAGSVAGVAAAVSGTDVALAESWRSRMLVVVAIVAAFALAAATYRRAISHDQAPTEAGQRRAAAWLAYRRRLRSRIPPSASVLAQPDQQRALALACVMGVAEHVLEQLPIAPEASRTAWSEAGGTARLVHVRYPVRPGFGQHPVKVAAVGAAVLGVAWWVRGYLRRVADGEALISLIERAPGQRDLITTAATLVAAAAWIPIVWGAWSVVAGLVDTVAARERTGLVVRTRRPSDVLGAASVLNPFADRERIVTYLAVDDGRRRWVSAWLASERTAAPQGAQARVRATPLLGFVRSSEPVGTAARRT